MPLLDVNLHVMVDDNLPLSDKLSKAYGADTLTKVQKHTTLCLSINAKQLGFEQDRMNWL